MFMWEDNPIGVVPACPSLPPLGLQEHWLGFAGKGKTRCLQPPAAWKRCLIKNTHCFHNEGRPLW